METADINKIAVIGGGTMGNGIAHVCAQTGYDVVLIEREERFLERALASIARNLDRMVKKEKITSQDKEQAISRIRATTEFGEIADCDVVIEAVFEERGVKREVWRAVDQTVKAGALLASNTSTIPITELAAFTERPADFIGMHFMNPVPVMKLVEVIRGLETSDVATALTMSLAEQLGKVPVEVNDYPGFISNRILMPMINEAVYAVMEGVAALEAVDSVMKLGMNHPMGPLTLADFIGLDVCLAIMEVLYDGFRDSKYRPCPLLRKMVAAGRLGRKSGRGFYDYSAR
ncbi:MAG: 3-hydroxybutyryl-CoA dehydrogenase [Candidatus Coatesbacteria bacterium]|nr:3-hydroxybutyryl-CoA dehydrogenase [Candidatus Coatesbacteria bacterium]